MSSETVRALSYRVVWEDNVDYEKAPAIHADTDAFSLSLSGRELRAELRQPLHDIAEARRLVDEYLEAWKVLIGLQHDPDEVRFVFERAEVAAEEVDPQTGKLVRTAKVFIDASCNMSAVPSVSRGSYPAPPKAFAATPDVGVMYARYEGYRKGREPLLSMANFCLTVLEESAGGRTKRREASKKYFFDYEVLHKLGALCARGSQKEARKAPQNLTFEPLQPNEEKWVGRVVKEMIRRAGEVAAEPNRAHRQIRLEDLPALG